MENSASMFPRQKPCPFGLGKFNPTMTNKLLVSLLGIVLLCVFVEAHFEFTNVVCEAVDKSFTDYEYCFIKAVNRSYKYISFKSLLYQVPVTNVTVKGALLKRENGYKPFLYNVTIDACKFLKSRKKNKVVNYFYELIYGNYSNMNHTCPYYHDLIVEKLSTVHINNMFTDVLPMPKGEYAIRTEWIVFNKLRAVFSIYGKLS